MSDDPLVRLWNDSTRPLNWRAWYALSPAEQAVQRYHLMQELQVYEGFWWRYTHRELLELKAAAGHARDTPTALPTVSIPPP